MNLKHIALAAIVAATAAGCSGWGSKSAEYKGATARTVRPLEVPPELTTPSIDDRYAVPDPKAQTTYSAYTARNTPGAGPLPAGANATTVLPKVDGARLERVGDQRWLIVQGEPASVWPIAKDFWIENGYTLVRDEPNNGILETEWYEDKARIPQDIVRRTIGKVVPNIFSHPRRDKFRTRLEKGAQAGTTEVFISNRQVEEVFADSNQDRTIWQAKPADRELEAEMLQRLVVKMGAVEADKAAAAAAAKPVVVGDRGAPIASTAGAAPARNAVMDANGALVVNDSFDRAWRRVGLALDRVGFTVEDRDRSKGLFFVRYIDPDKEAEAQKPKEGFLNKLKFWESNTSAANLPQYRIYVADAGANMSQVQVQDQQGAADKSNTSKKIITLLYDQLK